MAQLNTRIILRNDSTANWAANSTQILLKGEMGFEFFEDGSVKAKVGDGTKSWAELDYFGGSVSDLVGDGKSIAVEDGKIKIAGFDLAEVGAQPRKAADGSIEWIVPSSETVEGLQTTVAGLQSDISNLQDAIGTVEEGADPIATRIQNLESSIETLNGDNTVDGSVRKIVSDEINAFATNITDDGVVNSYKELIDYVAEHGDEAAAMAADIAALQEKIGAIDENAQANVIEEIKLGDEALPVNDKSVTVPVGAGLEASDEITITDGVLGIGAISASKLVADTVLTLDGGNAALA